MMLGSKGLLFVPETNLVEMRTMLPRCQPVHPPVHPDDQPGLVLRPDQRSFLTATREANAGHGRARQVAARPDPDRHPGHRSLRRPGAPPSPDIITLFGGGESAVLQSYITFDHGRIFLVETHAPGRKPTGRGGAGHPADAPTQDELDARSIVRLRQLVKETQNEVPGLNVGLTGEPVLDHDQMTQSKNDTLLASIVSLILCALIFIYGYKETGRPVKATLCLLVGLAYTMAFTTLTVGHLNILTITFVPMLIGLAIDFGVHLITRYEEELRHGKTEAEALTKAMVFTGQGIFTGALTTARRVSGDGASPISGASRKWASSAAAACWSVSFP